MSARCFFVLSPSPATFESLRKSNSCVGSRCTFKSRVVRRHRDEVNEIMASMTLKLYCVSFLQYSDERRTLRELWKSSKQESELSVSISISDDEQDIFWLNNVGFRRFRVLVETDLENADLKKQMELAEAFSGVCLNQLRIEDKPLATALAQAFLAAARKVTCGDRVSAMREESSKITREEEKKIKQHFEKLELLMVKFLTDSSRGDASWQEPANPSG